jgi:hypothetical protein
MGYERVGSKKYLAVQEAMNVVKCFVNTVKPLYEVSRFAAEIRD